MFFFFLAASFKLGRCSITGLHTQAILICDGEAIGLDCVSIVTIPAVLWHLAFDFYRRVHHIGRQSRHARKELSSCYKSGLAYFSIPNKQKKKKKGNTL